MANPHQVDGSNIRSQEKMPLKTEDPIYDYDDLEAGGRGMGHSTVPQCVRNGTSFDKC